MAKNDYHVIMYRIMAYIYACMQDNTPFNEDVISFKRLEIPEAYYIDVIKELVDERYIIGIEVLDFAGGYRAVEWENPKITSKGVQFMKENSAMSKAKSFLMDLKDIIPGL